MSRKNDGADSLPLKTQPNCKKCYNFLMKKEGWISPAFKKHVSMVVIQDLLERIRKLGVLLLCPF